MTEKLAFSLALDLLFNGQNMDYCERPISLSAFETMAMFGNLPDKARVGIIAPGGGRLLKSLLDRGYIVDAYEGRDECIDHINEAFGKHPSLRLMPAKHLNDPIRRDKMSFDALFCMDDLRAFREMHEWTEYIQRIVRPGGYFVYSQISNILPPKQNPLKKHFVLSGNYNVSEDTAKQIRDSYFELEDWEPGQKDLTMARETLDMVKSGSNLRRNIKSGVEVRYIVWRRKSH